MERHEHGRIIPGRGKLEQGILGGLMVAFGVISAVPVGSEIDR